MLPEELAGLVEGLSGCRHLRLKGLMAMPPFSANPEDNRHYFRQMKGLVDDLLANRVVANKNLGLSMGMSGDFEVAIEEGATLVRVGTALFGARE